MQQIVRKPLLVEFETVERVIELVAARHFQAVTKKLGPIVRPGRKDGRLQRWVVGFGNSENVPIAVVRIIDLVVINIVFIGPGPLAQVPVSKLLYPIAEAVGLSDSPPASPPV